MVLGLDSTDKPSQIYGGLYGVHTSNPVTPGECPASVSPVIPDRVAVLGLAQLVLSALLIFHLLLALRNHVRIK